jgi:hypothetical protein
VLSQKDSSTDGKETGLGFDIDAKPSSILSVKAAVSRVDTDKSGESNSESIRLVANPNAKLNVQMDLAHADTDASGSEMAHTVKVTSALRPDLQLELLTMARNLERPEDESAQAMKLSTTALRNTTIQIDWSQKDSEVKGPEQFSGIRLETTPHEAIKLSGSLGQKETATAQEQSREARVEVSPFNHTKLGGGVSEIESNGAVVSRVTDVSASTKPVGFLEFSGAYKTREVLEQEDLSSLDVSLLLDTGSILKFTGAYSTNPEDKKGAVQRVTSQSIGLRSDFGKLKFKGGFTLKDEYLAGKQSEMVEVGLDYRLSSHSLLTTSYSIDEYKELSVLETEIYELGYTHKVGSRLHLYLGGKMKTYEKDRDFLEDQTEYEAEARVGIKF